MEHFSKKSAAAEIARLREQITKFKAQRDAHRSARARLRHKLDEAKQSLEDLEEDHCELWTEHFANIYNLASPDRDLVAHIAHRADSDFDTGVKLLITGYLAARRLARVVRDEGIGQVQRVLDFGCGCARVTRFLNQLSDGDISLYGCDIDGAAIDWCKANVGECGEFFVSQDRPPLPAELPEFDVITALSVFTHLPEDMQFEWLRELAGKLRPGGLLLATIHGHFERFIPEEMRPAFDEEGFAYTDLGKTPDLPDYYLSTFHSHRYIEERWPAAGFRVRRIHRDAVPQATVRQDLVVLERV